MFLENVNDYLKHWAPLVAAIGVVLSIFIFTLDRNINEKQIDASLKRTTCINLATTFIILSGEGNDWNYLTKYFTSIYWSNWSSILNDTVITSPAEINITAAIYNMESANELLDQMRFQEPFIGIAGGNDRAVEFRKGKMEEIRKIAASIKDQLEIAGYKEEDCP